MRSLIDSPFVSEVTRAALLERLKPSEDPPRFFSDDQLALLQAVALRLAGPMPAGNPINIAHSIDKRLANKGADGWRYDDMPADAVAYQLGLQGINEHAQRRFDATFEQLTGEQQDLVLTDVQRGDVPAEGVWQTVLPKHFFEELVTEVTEIVYAHPAVQAMIGYVGYADL